MITLKKLFTGKELEIMLKIKSQEIILPNDEAGSYFKPILTW
jgi:hypothetical protein